ncbi:MAG TPA: hypothetical protein PLD23_22180, partial [Armatimonadota bacterium]|nr:hypothetical protein [Armatimonadota bacterium]
QADDAAVRELDTTRPPAVLLTTWVTTGCKPTDGGRAWSYGWLFGSKESVPPRAGLVPQKSPAHNGPRSFATATWRESTAALGPLGPGNHAPWRLADYVPVEPDLTPVLRSVPVAFVSQFPLGPRRPLQECAAEGVGVSISQAYEASELLALVRDQPAEAVVAGMSMALAGSAKLAAGGLFIAPGGQSRFAWAIEAIGRVLDEVARPSLRGNMAGTGADPEWADEAWQCLAWQPDAALSEAQRRMFAGARRFSGLNGPQPDPVPGAALATRISFDLRLAHPEEEWGVSGPAGGYAVAEYANMSGSSEGFFPALAEWTAPVGGAAEAREEDAVR